MQWLFQMVLRTFLFALFLNLVRSPMAMMFIGAAMGMYIEHSQPGTTGAVLAWAEGKAAGAVASVNPFATVTGAVINGGGWDTRGMALR